MYAYLSSSCLEYKTAHAYNITEIPLLEFLEVILAYIVNADINLHSSAVVTDINKVGLTHITPACDTAGNHYILFFKLLKVISYLLSLVSEIKLCDFIRILAVCL